MTQNYDPKFHHSLPLFLLTFWEIFWLIHGGFAVQFLRGIYESDSWELIKIVNGQYFYSQYSEYEKVVIEDRVAKEQARRQAEQELEELKSATKVSKYSYIWYETSMDRF